MTEKQEGVYRGDDLPQEEVDRLRNFDYPNFATYESFSGLDLNDQSVLDIGAGSSPFLAEYIKERGGKYIPLDVNPKLIGDLKQGLSEREIPFYGVMGDVKKLPFQDSSVDFVHQRFVLMHLGRDIQSQAEAVQEALRVAKKDVILLEYNWRTLSSSENPELIKRFRDVNFEIMERTNPPIDPFAGEKLEELAKTVSPDSNFEIKHYLPVEGDYTKDLISLCKGIGAMARHRLNAPDLADKLDELRLIFEKQPINFVPAEIVALKIEKNT